MAYVKPLQILQAQTSAAATPAQSTGGRGAGRFATALARARKSQQDHPAAPSHKPSSPAAATTQRHGRAGHRGRLRRRAPADPGPPGPLSGLAPVVVPAAQAPAEVKAPVASALDLTRVSVTAGPFAVQADTLAPSAAPLPAWAVSGQEGSHWAHVLSGQAPPGQGGSTTPATADKADQTGALAPQGDGRAGQPAMPAVVQGGVRLAQASARPDPAAGGNPVAPRSVGRKRVPWRGERDAGPPSQEPSQATASPSSRPRWAATPGVLLRLKPGRRTLSGGNAQGSPAENPNAPVGLAPHKLRTGAVSPALPPDASPGHVPREATATPASPPKGASRGTWRVEGSVRPTAEGTVSQWRIKPFGKPPLYVAVTVHPMGAATGGNKAIGLTVQLPTHHPWASELATLTPGLSQHLADLHGTQTRVEVWVGGSFGGSGFFPNGQQDRPLWPAAQLAQAPGERPSEGSGPGGSGAEGVDFRA
jgi:hypothetical protein